MDRRLLTTIHVRLIGSSEMRCNAPWRKITANHPRLFRSIAHAANLKGSTCYILAFGDGQKVYLDYSLISVARLVARLRYDAGLLQSISGEPSARI